MKIGLVIDDSLDRTDGVQQYVLTLGKWLTDTGNDVHYLTSQTSRNDIPNIHSLAPNLRLRFNQNKVGTPLPAPAKPIRQLLADQTFDVLHFQLPHSPLLSGKIIKYAPVNTALVGTFHILPYSNLQKTAAKILAKIIARDLAKFKIIMSVSEPAQNFAKQCFNIDSVVVPNAIDFKKFTSIDNTKQKSNNNKIVYLGRMVPRKGVLQLIKAFNHANRKSSSSWNLIIAGEGPLIERAKSLAKTLTLSDKVKFIGFIEESKKAQLLNSANIAVFPSISGESFGIVLIEAMAAGSEIVIGGDNPGYRSVLGKWDDCLFAPKNTLEFGDQLALLMSDANLRRKIGKQQQSYVDKFNIQVVGKQIMNVYKQAVGKTKRNL